MVVHQDIVMSRTSIPLPKGPDHLGSHKEALRLYNPNNFPGTDGRLNTDISSSSTFTSILLTTTFPLSHQTPVFATANHQL